jgi:hypothetical protein
MKLEKKGAFTMSRLKALIALMVAALPISAMALATDIVFKSAWGF